MSNNELSHAVRKAIHRAKVRGNTEISPDDLLVGMLQTAGRFGVVVIDSITIDLEAWGLVPLDEVPSGRPPKAAYTPRTAALFDRAAALARQDGARNVELVHMLADGCLDLGAWAGSGKTG